jgi:DNA-binding NtrC family response regulator
MSRSKNSDPETAVKVLAVDDDPDVREVIRVILQEDHEIIDAEDAAAALRAAEDNDPDVVLLDLNLGRGQDGFHVLERLRMRDPELPVIILSQYRDAAVIVRAMKAGAEHYIAKPPLQDELVERVRIAAKERRRAFALESQRPPGATLIIGSSREMGQIREMARAAARSTLPVMILGETGAGKGLVARCIHAWGKRSDGPYREVNVAGLPSTVLDSELFGHERGAFTGADRKHRGLFELASSGTMLLDEIGDLPRDSQVKLLRVVEDGTYRRVGGESDLRTSARIITATHQDLEQMIESGTFREDLYHRLAGLVLRIPPLREHSEDIAFLARAFLGERMSLSDEAQVWLAEQAWPGNVRELQQSLRRASLFAGEGEIGIEHLRMGVARPPSDDTGGSGEELLDLPYEQASKVSQDSFKRRYIERLLLSSGGNVSRAARRSGISRSHLHAMIRDLRLTHLTSGGGD